MGTTARQIRAGVWVEGIRASVCHKGDEGLPGPGVGSAVSVSLITHSILPLTAATAEAPRRSCTTGRHRTLSGAARSTGTRCASLHPLPALSSLASSSRTRSLPSAALPPPRPSTRPAHPRRLSAAPSNALQLARSSAQPLHDHLGGERRTARAPGRPTRARRQ